MSIQLVHLMRSSPYQARIADLQLVCPRQARSVHGVSPLSRSVSIPDTRRCRQHRQSFSEMRGMELTGQDQNIISIFPQCRDFIENALASGGTVLAHCNGQLESAAKDLWKLIKVGGLSTSPAIVIGYLMCKYGLTYEDTLNYVQSKRYCVSPTSVSWPTLRRPLTAYARTWKLCQPPRSPTTRQRRTKLIDSSTCSSANTSRSRSLRR